MSEPQPPTFITALAILLKRALTPSPLGKIKLVLRAETESLSEQKQEMIILSEQAGI